MADQVGFYFSSFMDWRRALTQQCNINLTSEYARERILALQDQSNPATREFSAKYGDAYLQQVIQWFQRAEKEG